MLAIYYFLRPLGREMIKNNHCSLHISKSIQNQQKRPNFGRFLLFSTNRSVILTLKIELTYPQKCSINRKNCEMIASDKGIFCFYLIFVRPFGRLKSRN